MRELVSWWWCFLLAAILLLSPLELLVATGDESGTQKRDSKSEELGWLWTCNMKNGQYMLLICSFFFSSFSMLLLFSLRPCTFGDHTAQLMASSSWWAKREGGERGEQ